MAALASAYEEAYPGMWQEVCDAFTAETGIEVELIVDKNLEDVIGPSMQGGDFPDTSVTNPYGGGKTYLAPMFYSPCGLFYNAGIFEEKGWTVPATWEEMWALGDKAKAEGIDLFTYPTTGYFDAFFYALMYSVGGPDFYNKALVYDEGVWDTPEGQQCFDIVAKLAEYTAKVTPAKAGGNGASYCWLEQAWIPAGAPNLDAAKQFVAFLYSDAACAIFAKGGAVQPVPGITDNFEGDNKLFYSIYDNGADAAMGSFAAYQATAGLGSNREEFFDPVNGLVNGSLSKDQWISDFKAASDQMRANLLAE